MAEITTPQNLDVCVVGGGPAGVILAYLLARKGVAVTLLESQMDFDRDFRGDTLHAGVLEMLDQLGMADAVLGLCNGRISELRMHTAERSITLANMGLLQTRFPFVALVPQARFLEFMVEQAQQFPNFQIHMGATATGLLNDAGTVSGVRFSHGGVPRELNARLVIGADGRGSMIRQLLGFELQRNAAPMDVIWFRVAKTGNEAFDQSATLRIGAGVMAVLIDRGDFWQVGYVILKGSYAGQRKAGMAAFHQRLAELIPEIAPGLAALTDWSMCATLSVFTGRVPVWYQGDRLLLLGDAAHVMSPVGGVGINYAIQDAVAAANTLVPALQENTLGEQHLRAIQHRRELPTRAIQRFQALVQGRIVAGALAASKSFEPPLPLRIIGRVALGQRILARFLAYGLRPELLTTAL